MICQRQYVVSMVSVAAVGFEMQKSRAKPRELRLCKVCKGPFYMSGHERLICSEPCVNKVHSQVQCKNYKAKYRRLRLAGASAEVARYFASHAYKLYVNALEQLKNEYK